MNRQASAMVGGDRASFSGKNTDYFRKAEIAMVLIALMGQARAESVLTEASAPVFSTGKEWTFAFSDRLDPRNDKLYTQVVTNAPTGSSTTLNVDNGRSLVVLDQNANVVSAGSERYEPSDGKLQFPMAVGKSWTGEFGNKGAGHIVETDWYAPAVGRIIMMDHQSRTAHSAARTIHIELQSTKPATAWSGKSLKRAEHLRCEGTII